MSFAPNKEPDTSPSVLNVTDSQGQVRTLIKMTAADAARLSAGNASVVMPHQPPMMGGMPGMMPMQPQMPMMPSMAPNQYAEVPPNMLHPGMYPQHNQTRCSKAGCKKCGS